MNLIIEIHYYVRRLSIALKILKMFI